MIADLHATAPSAWGDGSRPLEAAVALYTRAVAPRVSEEQMERDCDDNEWRQHNEEESP